MVGWWVEVLDGVCVCGKGSRGGARDSHADLRNRKGAVTGGDSWLAARPPVAPAPSSDRGAHLPSRRMEEVAPSHCDRGSQSGGAQPPSTAPVTAV